MFLMSLEARRSFAEVLVARMQMNTGAVRKLSGAVGDDLFEQSLRLFEFVLLYRLEPGLVILHSLCKSRVRFTWRFLRGDGRLLRCHRLSYPGGLCSLWLGSRPFNLRRISFLHSIQSLRPPAE